MIKSFPSHIAAIVRSPRGRRNLRVLFRFFFVLALLITVYTVGFHLLMEREGQEHSWITGFYWTLTVMSTLGFGDITFHTDLGRLFSILVLLSGMIFLLILLPFTFIEFFYEPWMAAQAEARAPRELPPNTTGHVVITNYDEVTDVLIRRLDQYQYPYAVLAPSVEEALRLHDLGLKVVVGDADNPTTWSSVRAREAALVVCASSDVTNTNVAFTVSGLSKDKDVPIIATAEDEASVDILELAGSSYVLRLEQIIGQSFALRTHGGDTLSHVIGQFDDLLIAEATTHGTPLVGKTIRNSRLREEAGVSVVGIWERGRFDLAGPDSEIHDNTILLLAGSKQHLASYDELFRGYSAPPAPVVILGGGRVGRATARALEERDVDYRIVEMDAGRIRDSEKYVHGSAADLTVLEKVGIRNTATVIITPRDDDVNVYLTIYCRRLRPDVQILSRATYEQNVATLHRAGADSVLSYASMGASVAMNMLHRNRILMVAEGLDLFSVPIPPDLAGRTISECLIREQTGCSVVAIHADGGTKSVPTASETLPAGAEMLLIGTVDSEKQFLEKYQMTQS